MMGTLAVSVLIMLIFYWKSLKKLNKNVNRLYSEPKRIISKLYFCLTFQLLTISPTIIYDFIEIFYPLHNFALQTGVVILFGFTGLFLVGIFFLMHRRFPKETENSDNPLLVEYSLSVEYSLKLGMNQRM